MKELLYLGLIIGVWVVLVRVVFPKLGIRG